MTEEVRGGASVHAEVSFSSEQEWSVSQTGKNTNVLWEWGVTSCQILKE